MRYRLAKPSDATGIADVYRACNAENDESFMLKLGGRFLRCYYRITLASPLSVAVCAENDEGVLIGFATGTLDASDQMALLRRSRLRLFVAALPRLILRPSLIRKMATRGSASAGEYIITAGPRWEYWGWHPAHRSGAGAITLHRAWLGVMKQLGVRQVRLEVNTQDKRIAKLHSSQGAILVREIVTPDGLRRQFFEYSFS